MELQKVQSNYKKRFLVIQTAFLGDLVLTTPLFSELRKKYPDSLIDVICLPFGDQLLSNQPGIFPLIYDKKKHPGLKAFIQFARKLRARGSYDIVFSVHRSFRSLLLGWLVTSSRRIGFRSFWTAVLDYEAVAYPLYQNGVHYTDRVVSLLSPLGIKTKINPLPSLDKKENAASDSDLRPITLSPFSTWHTKQWPFEKFISLADQILENTSHSIIWVGSIGEGNNSDLEQLERFQVKWKNRSLNQIGKTSIEELKHIISKSVVLISNDSASVHIASAYQVPCLVFFGPTHPKYGFYPLAPKSVVLQRSEEDVPCRPCHIHGPMRCPLKHFHCMHEIRVEHALQAMKDLMQCEFR